MEIKLIKQLIPGLLRKLGLSKGEGNVLNAANALQLMNRLLNNKIIFLILVALGFLFSFFALKTENIKTQNIKISESPTPIPSQMLIKPSSTPTPKVYKLEPLVTPIPTPKPTPSSMSIVTPDPIQQTPTPVIHTNKIEVSINSSTNFTVSLQDGSNQCDVLSESLKMGKISSLNMRYDENYKTYAVYKIDGLGKENSLWWTYSVNGKNPPLGCSLVKAGDRDKVVWIYIGPK